ncbi:MAG: ACP phosphodiesterase [Bacteroidales bacterium]|nr:ACP phosphodiesterase [Bacteroidales bacterium]
MNYLAHIFLSDNIRQRQVGNFIGDFVKGNQYENYPTEIKRGILLHRQIDNYTDSHPVVKETIIKLRETFGRYSGIVTDIYFDYFLAKNFSDYAEKQSLRDLSLRFYSSAVINHRHLPPRVKGFIWHFISTHRLGKYATLEGLKESLQIMERHKTPAISPDIAIAFLIENHTVLEKQFQLFFPDLILFVKNYKHK